MESKSEFIIWFQGVPIASANQLAGDLERELKSACISVRRQREDSTSQDFGGALVMVLGTPAVVAVARALHSWVVRKNAASLRIEDGNRRLIAENIESKDAADLVNAFSKSIAQDREHI